ncbi:MAG: peptidase M22 [Clostridia bacterium]|nr:peptidase M22 [Clostridia bacterium]
MKPCFVGFDTSNYTTSAAVCDGEGKVIANLKTPLPVKEGERGLRQSEAVFEHVRNLPELTVRLGDAMRGYTPLAVGVSVRPRDAEGSYMPCFLSGKSAAYSFAAGAGVPVYELSHQNGHIMAALYSARRLDLLGNDRFLAFHVSGGTTEALLVKPREGGFDVQLAGNTDDINAGQAIDRVGVAMGLKFPCGAELERLAMEYRGKIYSHPVCVRDGICSLSGVENIAKKIHAQTNDKTAAAAFVFDFIGKTLERMCTDIQKKYGSMPVIFAGGVMSNTLMRDRLSGRFDAYFSEPMFSADNAAGIALLCRENYKR